MTRTNTRHRQPPRQRIFFRRIPDAVEHFRGNVARAVVRRLYWALAPLWRGCTRGACRRHKSCHGDHDKCLARAWPLIPQGERNDICAEVRRGGPRRIPPLTDLEQYARNASGPRFPR